MAEIRLISYKEGVKQIRIERCSSLEEAVDKAITHLENGLANPTMRIVSGDKVLWSATSGMFIGESLEEFRSRLTGWHDRPIPKDVAKEINLRNPKYIPRSVQSVEKSDGLERELCDLLVYAGAIANSAGINLAKAMERKLVYRDPGEDDER
jgi:hypothetical protein